MAVLEVPSDGELRALDHHCHGVVRGDLERPAFESLLSEAPGTAARDRFASMLGLAVRRWCAPVLELEPHAGADAYLERRAELGWVEVTRRLLGASGVGTWLVDTGYHPERLTTPSELAELGGGDAHRVLRLESLAERAGTAASAAGWADAVEGAVRAALAERPAAVALKTVVAYRSGLAVPVRPPSSAALAHAAGEWLRESSTLGANPGPSSAPPGGPTRITDPVLGGWLVHLGVRLSAELGLPLQVHTGFGDPDVRLVSANPALLHDLLAATERGGARFMLLHCWPYHREAGYLAHVFGHVWVDVGLALPYVGARGDAVLAELLELAPFRAVCFSSDGYGLPELHFLGALLWRRALARTVEGWRRDEVITSRDGVALIEAVTEGNARAAYQLSSLSAPFAGDE